MLRFFSYNHLITFGFLFLLTFLLRVPSLHPEYFQEDESHYLVAAQQIVDGGAQYIDTFDNKPPVIIWVYALFVSIFGSYALLAIRLFTSIWLYLTALLLNQIAVDNKIIPQFSLFPAFLAVLLCSVPWYAQELNGEILMNLPIVLGVIQLLRLQERSSRNNTHLFRCGLLIGLAFMVKYQAILIFIGLGTAYFVTQPARLTETFSYFAGFLLSILGIVVALYFTGALGAYWDLGILYNLDYIRLGRNPGEVINPWFNLGQYGLLWGVFIVLALIGIFHFRTTFYKNGIRLRKVETIIFYWILACLATIVIGGGRLYLHYFYLLVPPLVIYATRALEIIKRPWVRALTLVAGFAVPIFTYGVYLISAYPAQTDFIDPYLTENGWVHGLRKQLSGEHPLQTAIDVDEVQNGILVLDYEPTIYTRLGLPCATPYSNFSTANFKMEILPGFREINLISSPETREEIYRAFQTDMPEYIIDTRGLFQYFQKELPLLMANYEPISPAATPGYEVYVLDYLPSRISSAP